MVNSSRKTNLFIILSGIFLTNAILAEIIGTKIFSAEATLGFEPGNIDLFGFRPEFSLTAGVLIWPVVFITTDVINEYFGKQGVRKISFMAIGFIIYSFLIIWATASLAPAAFWLDVNGTDANGNPFDVNYAFQKIFIQSTRIIIASLIAFLIGQLLDVFIFHKLRKITGSKMIWLRATGSTLVSQLIDSFVVLFVAFYFLAPDDQKWTLNNVFTVGITNYIYKFLVAIALTPLLYVAHYLIDNYLGKEAAGEMMEEAAAKSKSFF
ncbi:MAG: queuosine precursor transporter [Bacteroidota bacterium]